MNKHLVIGLGEIGRAIQSILECDGADKEGTDGNYEILHICIPYNGLFIETVKNYQVKHRAELTIIHSTVPIGTCKILNAVSSPCRGVHPYLEKGIRTFVKFFGGVEAEKASKFFAVYNIKVACFLDSESVEAMKLWDTTIYGLNILLEKEIHRFCTENNLNFDTVYTLANATYNSGYALLGMPQFKKYILKHSEGKIGGHCVLPNCELLNSWVSKLIIEKQ
jgi:UDP-N-acetyl-D-mannosaminuronate dehydrogenase